jgi:putative lipoprotein
MTSRLPRRSLSAALAAALAAVMLPACTTIEPAPAAAGASGSATASRRVVQGSVLYRERAALPADAQVRVQLVDAVSKAPEVIVLAETTFGTAGRQVPVPFALPVDTAKLEPGRSYALRGYILIDGKVSYVTATRVNVDPHAPPAVLTLLLSPGTADPVMTDSPPPPSAFRPAAPPSRSTLPRGSQAPQPPAK